MTRATKTAIREEIDRLWRRIDRLQAREDGRASVKVIEVGGGWVKRHRRDDHTRTLITITKPARHK